jgi:hypothetical protein
MAAGITRSVAGAFAPLIEQRLINVTAARTQFETRLPKWPAGLEARINRIEEVSMWDMKHFAVPVIAASVSLWAGAATADDRHAGYHYPVPQSTEVYEARAITLADAERRQRLAFVTGFTLKQIALPYPPDLAMFAKGEDAEKLIIVALDDGRMNTLYRARAVLAMLTATARVLPIFQEHRVEEIFTFLDLCKMLGFEQVTVSDGKDFAHQIHIE